MASLHSSLEHQLTDSRQLHHSFCTGHHPSRLPLFFFVVGVCKSSCCSSTPQPSHAHHQLYDRHQTATTPAAAAQHSTAQQATGGSSRAVRTLILIVSAELDHRNTNKHQPTNSTTSALPRRSSTTPTRQHKLDDTDSTTRTRHNPTITSEHNRNRPSTIDDVPRHCL